MVTNHRRITLLQLVLRLQHLMARTVRVRSEYRQHHFRFYRQRTARCCCQARSVVAFILRGADFRGSITLSVRATHA